MIASLLIAAVSFVLLVYWFRYSCILLLQSRQDIAVNPIEGEMEPLRRAIEQDYRMLTYLCRHAAALGDQSLEERLLMLDFKLMRLWFGLTRTAFPERARTALSEMAAVVAFLAAKMGEQAGLPPASTD
ncbi:MAG: hypothetical protein JO323_26095 [Acidobacteriia bacterium]|nr:hypothetical protein [Terriglobia bacterium]